MSTYKIEESIEKAFNDFEKSINGAANSELHTFRKDTFKKFQSIPFPTIKNEEWKYTNLRELVGTEFTSNTSAAPSAAVAESEGTNLYFVNGVFSKDSIDASLAEGLTITSLSDAIEKKLPESDKIGTLADNEDKFVSLNTSFLHQGIYIHVAKSKSIASPINIFNTHSGTDKSFSNPRVFIVAEENAEVKVSEQSETSSTEEIFENFVTEIIVKKDARVHYLKVQPDNPSLNHISNVAATQASNSFLHCSTLTLGGKLVRNNLHVQLNGEHSETYMNGLYMLSGKSHVDNHTAIDHTQPNCYSDELYKGILDESSRAVFNGKVFVRQAAQKTNAFQSNKNILLTDEATMNTKPQLEIWADDVKCTHGATSGQLDEEALFYLQARGLSPKSAKGLLLEAFAHEVVDRVEFPTLTESLKEIITKKLSN